VSDPQSDTLLRQIPKDTLLIDPTAVITVGATGLRDTFLMNEIPNILVSYMTALRVTCSIAVASVGLATLVAVFAQWQSIKGKATGEQHYKMAIFPLLSSMFYTVFNVLLPRQNSRPVKVHFLFRWHKLAYTKPKSAAKRPFLQGSGRVATDITTTEGRAGVCF
jgi:hypothetical protein